MMYECISCILLHTETYYLYTDIHVLTLSILSFVCLEILKFVLLL